MRANLSIESSPTSSNSMDLSTMLNAEGVSEMPTHEREHKQEDAYSPSDSLMNRENRRYAYLPPMIHPTVELESLQRDQNTRLNGRRLPPMNLSPPSSTESHSFHHQGGYFQCHNGNPPSPVLTLPPPHQLLQQTAPYHAVVGYSARLDALDHENLERISRTALSFRPRVWQDGRVRDRNWDVPLHRIRTPRSPHRQYSPHNDHRQPQYQKQQLSKKPHSNKPYTREQVHYMRYLHEDGNQPPWSIVLAKFRQQFPEIEDLSRQCLTSRLYRDNEVPKCDENGDPVFDANGKAIMMKAKVRGRRTPEGRNVPYTFVETHPDFALLYDWVSPQEKMIALQIIRSIEAADAGLEPMTRRIRCQKALRKIDLAYPELAALWRAQQ